MAPAAGDHKLTAPVDEFEGLNASQFSARLTGANKAIAAGFEHYPEVFYVGDTLHLAGVLTVTGVVHQVDEHGILTRVHTMRLDAACVDQDLAGASRRTTAMRHLLQPQIPGLEDERRAAAAAAADDE